MDDDTETESPESNVVSASWTVKVPCDAETAFWAFSNVTRHPEWSPWIRSVAYVDPQPEALPPSRYCQWTLGVRFLRFSWISETTVFDPTGGVLAWKSQVGLQNAGRLTLVDQDHEEAATMTLAVEFVIPRPVLALLTLRRGKGRGDSVVTRVVRVVERNILREILINFSNAMEREGPSDAGNDKTADSEAQEETEAGTSRQEFQSEFREETEEKPPRKPRGLLRRWFSRGRRRQ